MIEQTKIDPGANLTVGLTTPAHRSGLRNPKWMLVWSNPDIKDDVLIRKALATARFSTILQACLEFGIDRVAAQWKMTHGDVEHSTDLIDDILSNIRRGFERAQT